MEVVHNPIVLPEKAFADKFFTVRRRLTQRDKVNLMWAMYGSLSVFEGR